MSLAFSSSSSSSLFNFQALSSGKAQICGRSGRYESRGYQTQPRIRLPRTVDVRSCRVQETAAGVPAVPGNINEVVQACVAGIDEAVDVGHRRLRIRALIPGLNPSLEDSFPYSEKLLLMCVLSIARTSQVCANAEVNLRFKSTGTAASALQTYGGDKDPLPANVNLTIYNDTDETEENCDANSVNIIINPVAARGNPVLQEIETAVRKCPDAIWVLFNPEFTADRAALGMKDQQRRLDFLGTFKDVFYFRNLFVISRPKLVPIEKGALVHNFGAAWNTYAILEGDYKAADAFESEPSPSDISTSVQQCIDNNTERVPEVVDDEGYLKTLAISAVFLAFLWYAFRMLGSTTLL